METLAWVFAGRRRDAPASSLNDPWPARGRPDRGRQG